MLPVWDEFEERRDSETMFDALQIAKVIPDAAAHQQPAPPLPRTVTIPEPVQNLHHVSPELPQKIRSIPEQQGKVRKTSQ